MTVKELINQLSQFNPNLNVVLLSEGQWGNINKAELWAQTQNGKRVTDIVVIK